MKFKVDENLPIDVALILQQAGYQAETVFDEGLSGAEDAVIAETCQSEQRILITLDVGFADIRTYPPSQHPGMIVLRLDRQEKQNVLKIIRSIITLLTEKPIAGTLWIVSERQVRIRE
jgi:predicted nuclease of predicted toxin-antitoxin system